MKISGKRIAALKVQKVAVTKDGVILALQHNLRISEEKCEDEFVLLLGLLFFHSLDNYQNLVKIGVLISA